MKKATGEWVRKAEKDYRFAVKNARSREPFHDQLCFLCQQATEKYLKALQEELAIAIPRTHVLKDLLALLLPHYPTLASLRRGLTFLTRFAIETRYPGGSATRRDTQAALRWAGKVRDACRTLLGLRPPRRRRRRSP
jgi:HEPN domain-containing protein